jgi:uncharacterized repeat protein (TIGR03837 family)
LAVRLWVDELGVAQRLINSLDISLERQVMDGVEICRWAEPFADEMVADVVIEAFGCELPQSYLAAMAASPSPHPSPHRGEGVKHVWLNLEYLSAENWVAGSHLRPSPHPALPLTKYFFFPGFTEKTGGLLLERDLMARRDAFLADAKGQETYWRSLGVPQRVAGELRVSLFGYENEAMEALLHSWEQGDQPVTCLLPEGRSLPQVAAYFGQQSGKAGAVWQRGKLRVHVLPFVEQERYDELLWACDVNFVRGEDSCVRAQWAAKPLIWQIYPQHDGVHLEKLEALRVRYTAGLPPAAAQAVRELWLAWNGGQDIAGAWAHFAAQRGVLTRHGEEWARRLANNNLALNLLDFFRQSE